jgi:hypothetical protein
MVVGQVTFEDGVGELAGDAPVPGLIEVLVGGTQGPQNTQRKPFCLPFWLCFWHSCPRNPLLTGGSSR